MNITTNTSKHTHTGKHINILLAFQTMTQCEQHSVIWREIQLSHYTTYAKHIMEISKAVEVWHHSPF